MVGTVQNGYTQYSLDTDGVPLVSHLHGGHSRSSADGNPEYFFSPNFKIRGPRWESKWYDYDNDQAAGNLWYHDHCLGITRLNVYAGLAGVYVIRETQDSGFPWNPLGLPAYPYELAYAIQDRMFWDDGELFYPAFPGEPFYDDFITGEGASLPGDLFPGGGPSALAEFFGDHMVVNGIIWPKTDVEPRNYRMHLHLVNFEILGRNHITYMSDEGDPGQVVIQHNGAVGKHPTITNVQEGDPLFLTPGDGYAENAPKDMVTALPDQVTKIKATFDKPGRYVWHCHILSHEDHEMMRVLHVGPGA